MEKQRYSLIQNLESENLEWHVFLSKWKINGKKICKVESDSLCKEMGYIKQENTYRCKLRRELLEIIIDLDAEEENICGNCMKTFFKTK